MGCLKMSKSKLLKPEDKIQSVNQKKINKMRKKEEFLRLKILRYKKQCGLDHRFKELLKNKNKELYYEIVNELEVLKNG
jgi:hypothetical protein